MPSDSATLILHTQFALELTQKELGAMLGLNRRTIQRWQKRGCTLLPTQARLLADALRPVRPDLADAVLELGRRFGVDGGLAASADTLDAIVAAAAEAGGMSAETARAVVTAAFQKAADEAVGVGAVLWGLRAG